MSPCIHLTQGLFASMGESSRRRSQLRTKSEDVYGEWSTSSCLPNCNHTGCDNQDTCFNNGKTGCSWERSSDFLSSRLYPNLVFLDPFNHPHPYLNPGKFTSSWMSSRRRPLQQWRHGLQWILLRAMCQWRVGNEKMCQWIGVFWIRRECLL